MQCLQREVSSSIMKLIVCLFLLITVQTECAKILGIFNIPSVSHQIVYQPIWKELSLRGHEVTVMSPNILKDPSLTNLTEIDLGYLYEGIKVIEKNIAEGMNHWHWNNILKDFSEAVTKLIFEHREVQKLVNDDFSKFDIVLVEALFPAPAIFSVKFNCPLLGIASLSTLNPVHEIVGSPGHPILYPDLSTTFSEHMTFFEKIDAVLFYWYHRYLYYHRMVPAMNSVIKQYFGENAPDIADIMKNMSMIFLNTNPIIHKPRPYGPNVLELGGRMHLKPRKPLPLDLQNYLDNATEGVIYFSLGSNVKSAFLNPTKRKIIMEALSELPYKILWKFETDYMEDQPKNVKISKWLPQQDLLRHKNIKLFIMQGGLQSLEEAVTNGVPLLAIPFFADQFNNAERIAELGIGLQLDFNSITKEPLKSAILKIINNKQYKEKTVELGKLLNDEMNTGLEKAVWWIEYVIRNKGATHFRNRVVDMPWHEYLILDVYAFLIFTSLLLSFILYKILVFFVTNVVNVSEKIKES